jgi:hypothetical protein
VETLERIVNPKKPPLTIGQIDKGRAALVQWGKNKTRLGEARANLQDMEKAYVHGRGDLSLWTTEILNKIDIVFVQHFMLMGDPIYYLFMPRSAEYLNGYEAYRKDVEEVLEAHEKELPPYCRAYFNYSTLWQMRNLQFPLPLGTQSAVHCLHRLASERRKGFVEVSDCIHY